MQNVDTAYVFTVVLPYIKIGEVGYNRGLFIFFAKQGRQ